MARKKNSSFAGASVFDCRVDSPTFRRVVEDGIGDTALIFDMLTGEHAEANTITHAGDGRGCPIGLTLANQFIGRSLKLTSPAAIFQNGGTGETIIAPYVVLVPPGEDSIVVEVYVSLVERATDAFIDPHLLVLSTDGLLTVEANVQMARVPIEDLTLLVATATGLAPGYHLVFPTIDTDVIANGATIDIGTLLNVILHHGLGQSVAPGGPLRQEASTIGVTTPTSAAGLPHTDFEAGLFADEDPICSYLLAGWNRNLNGLDEYQRGWPAGGNAAYVHVDDSGGVPDASNPSRSHFEAHTRTLHTSEGETALPMICESLGAYLYARPDGVHSVLGTFAVELAEPPTFGMLDWYAPWPITTAAQNIHSLRIPFPDFQSTSSRLKMAVLIGSDSDADVASWSFFGTTAAGTSAAATPVDLGDGTLWLAECLAIPFTGDANDTVSLRCSRSGAKTGIGELCILAICLHYDP